MRIKTVSNRMSIVLYQYRFLRTISLFFHHYISCIYLSTFLIVLVIFSNERHQILKLSIMQSTSAGDQPTASASASGFQETNAPSHPHQQTQQHRIVDALPKGN